MRRSSQMSQDSLFAFVLMPFDQILSYDRIYRQIEVADIVIADMTGKNPNVFYEVGYAHAKGKLTILLTSDATDIPFDLKHTRHIVYGQSITTLRERLIEDLQW